MLDEGGERGDFPWRLGVLGDQLGNGDGAFFARRKRDLSFTTCALLPPSQPDSRHGKFAAVLTYLLVRLL